MQTRSSLQRRSNSESSDRVVAHIKPRSWGDETHEQPQTVQPKNTGFDFKNADWFSHDPGPRSPVRVFNSIQAKLTVGAPNDQYEQEADRVAEQVVSTPDSAVQQTLQREAMPEEEEELQTKSLGNSIQREAMPEEEEELQTKPLAATITPLVQREAMPEEEEELQTKSLGNSIQRETLLEEEEELQTKPLGNSIQREVMPEEEEEIQTKALGDSIQREAMPEEEEEIQTKRSPDASFQESSNLESRLNSSQGGGSPLPDEVRSFMEPRFGADFSQVRVHTGNEAVQMNQDLNAQAFTHQQDIYFGAGKAPDKDALTAHELTHVVQQTGSLKRKCVECEEENNPIRRKAQINPQNVLGMHSGINLIQRDKIDYRPLTWVDFKAKPPKSQYDAATKSDFHDPHLDNVSPTTHSADNTHSECKGGKDNKTFKVKLSVDPKTLEIKSFMDQDQSWKKAWTTDPTVSKQKCTSERQSNISECKTFFSTQEKSVKKDCSNSQKECTNAFTDKESSSFSMDFSGVKITANNKDECKSVLLPGCIKEMNKGATYTYGKAVIKGSSDCESQILSDCPQAMQQRSSKLLQHEQTHFDITQLKAKEIQEKLRQIAGNFETDICLSFKELTAQDKKTIGDNAGKKAVAVAEAERKKAKAAKLTDAEKNTVMQTASQKAITEAEDKEKKALEAAKIQALEKAKKELIKKLKDTFTEEFKAWKATQSKYDDQTTHGTVDAEQQRWQAEISKGIKEAEDKEKKVKVP